MKKEDVYYGFMNFFDGIGNDLGITGMDNVSSTYAMGVTNLDYNEETNVLNVSLRRPGLLIGRRGSIIDVLKNTLECEIYIIEVKQLW